MVNIDVIENSCLLRRANLLARAQAALVRRRVPESQGAVRPFNTIEDWLQADQDAADGGTWVVLLHSSEQGWEECVRACAELADEDGARISLVSYTGRPPGGPDVLDVDGITPGAVDWWRHFDGVSAVRDIGDQDADLERAIQEVGRTVPPVEEIVEAALAGRPLAGPPPADRPAADAATVPPDIRHDLVNAVGPLSSAAGMAATTGRPIAHFRELWDKMDARLARRREYLPDWVDTVLRSRAAAWADRADGPSAATGEVQQLANDLDRILAFAFSLGRTPPDWKELRAILEDEREPGGKTRALWIDDEDTWPKALGEVFSACGIELTAAQDPAPWAQNPDDILTYDAIILDMRLNGAGDRVAAALKKQVVPVADPITDANAGIGLLQLFASVPQCPPVFILSARESTAVIRACTRHGARGYLVKGRADYVGFLVNLVREVRDRRTRLDAAVEPKNPLLAFGPSDDPLRGLLKKLDKIARRRDKVLLHGEPGVGKGELATEIHLRSGRKGALVIYDCSRASAEGAESDLYGHVAGAYTSAGTPRKGYVESANGGTLFIDEIDKGKNPREIVEMLMNLLERKEFFKKGDNKSAVEYDVLFVLGTNVNPKGDEGLRLFGPAFYSRVTWILEVPNLRDRASALESLVGNLLPRICAKCQIPPIDLSAAALAWLRRKVEAHALAGEEGNVRGLRNLLDRATAYLDDGESVLQQSHLETAFIPPATNRTAAGDAAFVEIGRTLADHLEASGGGTLDDIEGRVRTGFLTALEAKLDRKAMAKLLRVNDGALRATLFRAKKDYPLGGN